MGGIWNKNGPFRGKSCFGKVRFGYESGAVRVWAGTAWTVGIAFACPDRRGRLFLGERRWDGFHFDQIRPGNEIGFAPVNMNKAAEVSEAGGEIGGDEVR